MSLGRAGYHYTRHRKKGFAMQDLYYALVGDTTDTNMGLVRFMGAIIAFIVIGGGLFWAIG